MPIISPNYIKDYTFIEDTIWYTYSYIVQGMVMVWWTIEREI